jgi:hypothetical protein
MSAEALPISTPRFAAALSDLPISSLYAKHAELKNNIAHMETSNKQLEDYARDNDDRDCYEALLENRQVIRKFLERIELIKKEVSEVRGLPWRPQGEDEKRSEVVVDGTNGSTTQNGVSATGVNGGVVQHEQGSGMDGQNGDGEDGVYL